MPEESKKLLCSDPEIQRQSHELLAAIWPNMAAMSLPEFTMLFSEILKAGAVAQGHGLKLTQDFYARLAAGFLYETARRGFGSYREMAETAVEIHQVNQRDRERDGQVH